MTNVNGLVGEFLAREAVFRVVRGGSGRCVLAEAAGAAVLDWVFATLREETGRRWRGATRCPLFRTTGYPGNAGGNTALGAD